MERRYELAIACCAAAYLVIGLAFGAFSAWAATDAARLVWRRSAWLVSGIAFAAQIAYGHFGSRDSPRRTAIHAGAADSLGAGALAGANVHEILAAQGHRRSVAAALVAWPLLTGIPAFLAALVSASALNRWWRRS